MLIVLNLARQPLANLKSNCTPRYALAGTLAAAPPLIIDGMIDHYILANHISSHPSSCLYIHTWKKMKAIFGQLCLCIAGSSCIRNKRTKPLDRRPLVIPISYCTGYGANNEVMPPPLRGPDNPYSFTGSRTTFYRTIPLSIFMPS